MKPRNHHALNAIQRKAGFHSGKRRPAQPQRVAIEEQVSLPSVERLRFEIDSIEAGTDELLASRCDELTAETERLQLYPWQQRGSANGRECNSVSGEFEVDFSV